VSAASIVGTWRLADYYLEGAETDGERPLGDDPLGRLLYTADGFMAVEYMLAARPMPKSENWRLATDQERLEAVRSFGGYIGRYEWFGDRVAHHVEVSVNPRWIGATLVRRTVLDGSRLTLHADTPSGRWPTPVLVWERLTGPET
jgi:hypothetical protein